MGSYLPMLGIAMLASTPLMKTWVSRWENTAAVRYGKIAAAAMALTLCAAALASQSYNPFIYFRF